MLTFMQTPEKLTLKPHTVEPLLELAGMIDFQALVQRCGTFLRGEISWDPIGVLMLAEEHQLIDVYPAAVDAVMKNYSSNKPELLHCLGESTINKVSRNCRTHNAVMANI